MTALHSDDGARIASGKAPIDRPEVVRLADVCCKCADARQSLDMVRHLLWVVMLEADLGIASDMASVARAMIETRRGSGLLEVHASRVDELVERLATSWTTRDQ